VDLKSLSKAYDKTFGVIQAHKDKTTEFVGQGLQATEVTGSCYLFSYANGRSPAMNKDHHELTEGVPTDLAIGVLGHVVAFFGGASQYGEHLHNLSDGALASWSARMGTAQGSKARLKAGSSQKQATPGAFPPYTAYEGAGNVAGFTPAPQYQGVG